jgi:deoxyribose-phosphate aldolase
VTNQTVAKRIERAAGGLVLRVTKQGIEILMIDDAYGKVTFPKGHLEVGENWEAAAIREVREETGIDARILAPLGRVEYDILRDGHQVQKQVRFFLMEAIDESEEPLHQAEEVQGAFYLSWEMACALHTDRGYENWQWLFDKAAALWQWHQLGLENSWRLLPTSSEQTVIDAAWENAQPVVEALIQATRQELQVTAPNMVLPTQVDVQLPQLAVPSTEQIQSAVEHTLLKPEGSAVDVENLAKEADHLGFPLICINPQFVAQGATVLRDSQTQVCTVIGFPLGAGSPQTLAAELTAVVQAGAREVDMVLPIGSMKEDDISTVFTHVAAVVDAAHRQVKVPMIKVILETSALTFDQVIKASLVCLAAGADFIKTSTGFHTAGARLADVCVMARVAGHSRRVKASGGIRTRHDAAQMLRYGASRLGTSSGAHLLRK